MIFLSIVNKHFPNYSFEKLEENILMRRKNKKKIIFLNKKYIFLLMPFKKDIINKCLKLIKDLGINTKNYFINFKKEKYYLFININGFKVIKCKFCLKNIKNFISIKCYLKNIYFLKE
ncbi:hypothetical protein [Candidatus Vidania fulgoroideorum]